MHRLPPPTPSPVSTYCSDLEFKCIVGSQIRRRSQRLIDKENQELAKTSTPKCRSPQLFGESEDLYSQILCQQSKEPCKVAYSDKFVHPKSVEVIGNAKALDQLVRPEASESSHNVVNLEPLDKALKLKSSCNIAKIVHLKEQKEIQKSVLQKNPESSKISAKILHLKEQKEIQKAVPKKNLGSSKPSSKILHLKEQKEVTETCNEVQKNLKRKMAYQLSSQPATKRSAMTPLNRHEAVKEPLSKTYLSSSPTTSQSKLPPKYPDHFAKQVKDTQHHELCPTAEPSAMGVTYGESCYKSSPHIDSESSLTISLSDSIGEIFGSKDVSEILDIKFSRQYILMEEHLPAVASMLNVDVDRLRNVLEITQRLTHEQILGFPVKREADQSEDEPSSSGNI